MEQFGIPVVLLIFKRKDKIKKIMERISQIQPQKIYIIADGPRNEEERSAVEDCRKEVEDCIKWRCDIIKNYSIDNRGVYENIALGAKWVFEREEYAIFLEDDNLPELTFFPFCKELLKRYSEDTRVLWICGTNYLQKYEPEDGSSYLFTKHLMPCGWASWSKKFLKFYDGKLELMKDEILISNMKYQYENKSLYKQQISLARTEKNRIDKNMKPYSWDYQMEFSIRANNLYGISPKFNQIENIGVDNDSIHGGTDFSNVMTRRFCMIKSYPLEFPLKHPLTLLPDKNYEKKVGKIILYPLGYRWKLKVLRGIRFILRIPDGITTKQAIKSIFYKNKL